MKAALAAGLALSLLVLTPAPAASEVWTAAGLTFSDELGGFRLISVSGSGTVSDPIVIVEEITDTAPAVLVVRGLQTRQGEASRLVVSSFTYLALVKVVKNLSRRVWIGFELELQEELRRPSPYDDGLSFDQMNAFRENPVRSDRFAYSRRISEPYDRVRFDEGTVEPGETARFHFNITDPTPAPEFYLLQEPRLLISGIPPAPGIPPGSGRQTAALPR